MWLESLYNDITFRTMVFEYRQAVLALDDYKKRMFRSIVTGNGIYYIDNWDNNVYTSKMSTYGDVLYDMLVRLPKNVEDERESIEKLCK